MPRLRDDFESGGSPPGVRSQGGLDSKENLITLCASCHEGVHQAALAVRNLSTPIERTARPATVGTPQFYRHEVQTRPVTSEPGLSQASTESWDEKKTL